MNELNGEPNLAELLFEECRRRNIPILNAGEEPRRLGPGLNQRYVDGLVDGPAEIFDAAKKMWDLAGEISAEFPGRAIRFHALNLPPGNGVAEALLHKHGGVIVRSIVLYFFPQGGEDDAPTDPWADKMVKRVDILFSVAPEGAGGSE